MKYTLFLLVTISLLSCKKESTNEDKQLLAKHSVTIMNKADTLLRVEYNDSVIFLYKAIENNKLEETSYRYNTNGTLIGLTIKNAYYNDIVYKDFIYDSMQRICTINSKTVRQNGDSIKDVQRIDYNELGELIKINSPKPETFEFTRNNVTKHGNVIEYPIWGDFVYSYDTKVNPLHNIGLAPISVSHLSINNIKTKVALWLELVDCMLKEDTNCDPINHVDTIYTSTFVYNSLNKPTIEYRKYKMRLDTLRYYYE